LKSADKESCDNWFNNIACKHARWNKKQNIDYPSNKKYEGLPLQTPFKLLDEQYVCDHAGTPKKNEENANRKAKRVRKMGSIKIKCPASIFIPKMTDQTYQVTHKWGHP
jgi:hypothetical protein